MISPGSLDDHVIHVPSPEPTQLESIFDLGNEEQEELDSPMRSNERTPHRKSPLKAKRLGAYLRIKPQLDTGKSKRGLSLETSPGLRLVINRIKRTDGNDPASTLTKLRQSKESEEPVASPGKSTGYNSTLRSFLGKTQPFADSQGANFDLENSVARMRRKTAEYIRTKCP